MKKHKKLFVGTLLATIFLVAFCCTFFIYKNNTKTGEKKDDGITIVTSFYPMYIASLNICQDVKGITLENLSEPETGCLHDYQLTPEDMKLLQSADVFVVNGGGIEEFLTEVAKECPNLTIIDASEGIDLIEDNAHVWMSIPSHKKQIENIAAGLIKVDQANQSSYEKNRDSYLKKIGELEDMEKELAERISNDDSVVIFQEAYAYFARDFGLSVAYTMDLDEERQISAGEVSDVISAIDESECGLIIADELYGKEMAELVTNQTTAQVIYVDTMVRGDYKADSYLLKMRQNIQSVASYYGVNMS